MRTYSAYDQYPIYQMITLSMSSVYLVYCPEGIVCTHTDTLPAEHLNSPHPSLFVTTGVVMCPVMSV